MAIYSESVLDKCLPRNRASWFSAVIAAVLLLSGPLLAPPAQAEPDAAEISFWESVKDTGNPAELKAYLDAYPEGAFAALARIRLNGLKQGSGKDASVEAQPSQAGKTGPASKTGEPAVHDCDLLAAHPWDPAKKASGVHLYAMNAALAKRACEAALAANPGTARFQFQLGRAHHSLSNYGEAAKLYRQAADKGHAAAMANLAIIYIGGLGVAKDDVQAAKWWRKAVDNGMESATINSAGVAKDATERSELLRRGFVWHREVAAKGDALSMFVVGLVYFRGQGVTEDKAEAVRWWHKAADNGFPRAMTLIGRAYENSWSVTKDKAEAVKWYRKAAGAGETDAMIHLGRAYAKGQGVTKDEAEAIKWYRKAADKGNTDAMFDLGYAYESGTGVLKDRAEAVRLYRLAVTNGIKNRDAVIRLVFLGETIYDLAEIQRLLAIAGFDPGPADGKMGAKTREAIRAYQRRAGLDANGEPSLALLKHLNKSASGPSSTAPSAGVTTKAGGSRSSSSGLGDLNSLD